MIRDWDEAKYERSRREYWDGDGIDPDAVLYSDAIYHLYDWFHFVPHTPETPPHWIVTRRRWRRTCKQAEGSERVLDVIRATWGADRLESALNESSVLWKVFNGLPRS